jgi:hypothetical protein
VWLLWVRCLALGSSLAWSAAAVPCVALCDVTVRSRGGGYVLFHWCIAVAHCPSGCWLSAVFLDAVRVFHLSLWLLFELFSLFLLHHSSRVRNYLTYTSLMCVECVLDLDTRCYLLTSVAFVVWWTVDGVDLRVCSCYCSVLMSADMSTQQG